MKLYTDFSLETAACLWEAVLSMRDCPAADPDAMSRALAIRKAFETLGTSSVRLMVMNWTDAVEATWRQVEKDYLLSFDWDFVPQWIADHIDWSDPFQPVVRHKEYTCLEKDESGIDPMDRSMIGSRRQDHLALLIRAQNIPGRKYTAAMLVEEPDQAIARLALSSLPWPVEVHIGIIETRSGVNFHVALTEEALLHEIAGFAREWWAEIDDERDPHLLPDRAVTGIYFDDHPHESYTMDRVLLEPLPQAVAPAQSLEVGVYCVLSTAHLTVQSADLLDKWAAWPPTDRPIDIAASIHGWFVPTRITDEDRRAKLPEDLLHLMDFGRERGFRFLLLDCDGDAVDGLPVHDW